MDNGFTPATLPNLAGHKVRELERRAICDTLDSTEANITRSAELLGITSRTLQRKIADDRDLYDHVQALRRRNAEVRWRAREEAESA